MNKKVVWLVLALASFGGIVWIMSTGQTADAFHMTAVVGLTLTTGVAWVNGVCSVLTGR